MAWCEYHWAYHNGEVAKGACIKSIIDRTPFKEAMTAPKGDHEYRARLRGWGYVWSPPLVRYLADAIASVYAELGETPASRKEARRVGEGILSTAPYPKR